MAVDNEYVLDTLIVKIVELNISTTITHDESPIIMINEGM